MMTPLPMSVLVTLLVAVPIIATTKNMHSKR